MDALDLVRMGHPLDLRTQLFWARSQRRRTATERLLLYELVAIADGTRTAWAGTRMVPLLSGLTHLPEIRVRTALARLEHDRLLTRHTDGQGAESVELAFPPRDGTNKPECAHVRLGEGQ